MHLTEEFVLEPGNGGSRDSFLKEKNIETFLIKPQIQTFHSELNLR